MQPMPSLDMASIPARCAMQPNSSLGKACLQSDSIQARTCTSSRNKEPFGHSTHAIASPSFSLTCTIQERTCTSCSTELFQVLVQMADSFHCVRSGWR